MAARNTKSYAKYTFGDLKKLGLEVIIVDLFEGQEIAPVAASSLLKEILESATEVSLDTEKARSEFIIAPVLRELQKRNKNLFSVYSGFNFDVDIEKGLHGFCDYLLVKLPLKIVPDAPIIAVVEAKLSGSLSAAVPQCAAEMYATRIWNEQRNEPIQTIYGTITTGEQWLFLRYREGMTIEVDTHSYALAQLETVLGVWQHIINQFK